jgi:hypothetical protein
MWAGAAAAALLGQDGSIKPSDEPAIGGVGAVGRRDNPDEAEADGHPARSQSCNPRHAISPFGSAYVG